jgi:hypothetical protein
VSGKQRNIPWYPRIEDLKLHNVPVEEQAEIRNILKPALGNIPVESGECWRSAQRLTLAGGPEVKCIEGAYVRHPENRYLLIERINELLLLNMLGTRWRGILWI